MKYNLTLLSIYLLINLHAQPHPNWINYTNSQQIRSIDIHGNDLWISTMGGLVKYNKATGEKTYYNRANSNLPDNNLLSVLYSSDDNVWVTGRYHGIGKFNGSKCQIFNESNSPLPFNQWNIKILEDKDGNIWVSSFRTMTRFNSVNLKTWITGSDFSAYPAITSFDIDDNGVVWLFSSDGIGKIENNEYTVVSTIGSSIASKNSFVKIDNNNRVWVAIQDKGIYRYDGSKFINYNTENSCLPTNTITAIASGNDNNLWLSSYIGLIKFNLNGCELFQPNGNEQALLTVQIDNDNEIWCGSFNGNLLKFDNSNFESIELSNSPLASNAITDIYASNDNIWIGTGENIVTGKVHQLTHSSDIKDAYFTKDENGNLWIASNLEYPRLLQINGNDTIVYDSLNSPIIPQLTFTDITVNSNGLWFATKFHGLFRFFNSEFINYTQANSNIPSNKLFCLISDSQNNLWVGSKSGLIKFNGVQWDFWNKSNSTIPTDWVKSIAIDMDNTIWFACLDEDNKKGIEYGGGLTKFDDTTMQSYNISNSGLLSNTIFSIADDGKKIWLGTDGAGLMSFDKTNIWENFNVSNSGIAHNSVSNLCIDAYGNIWMGHDYFFGGVSVFNPESQTTSSHFTNLHELTIYPNPVKDNLYITVDSGFLQNKTLKLYDISGRLINDLTHQSHFINSNTLVVPVSNYIKVPQLYILKISDNKTQYCAKFMYLK